jgi:hypothetical protein
MTPDSAQPTLSGRIAAPANGSLPNGDEAVETFSFDVSAGKKVVSPANEGTAAARVDPLPLAAPTSPKTIQSKLTAQPNAVRIAGGAVKALRKRRRRPAWLASVLVHAAVILPMGFMTIAGLPQAFDFTLSLNTEPAAADEVMFDEIAIEPVEEFQNVDSLFTQETAESTALAESHLDSQIALASLSSEALADAALSDASALFGSEGSGLAEMVPSGAQLTASFFGTKVDSKRICMSLIIPVG